MSTLSGRGRRSGAAAWRAWSRLTLMERAAETASVVGDNTRAQVLARQVLARIDRPPNRAAALRWERLAGSAG